MFLLYVYLSVAVAGVFLACVYQGYCDAKQVRNKLAVLINYYVYDRDNEHMVLMLTALWPVTLFILLVYLFFMIIGFPFWFVYQFSKRYFNK